MTAPAGSHKVKPITYLLIGGLCVCVALSLLPEDSPLLPACHIHRLTGLLCPGCGTTRALRALLHGDMALSLRQNPLLLPGFSWLAALVLIKGTKRFNGLLWGGIVVIALFTLLRNLPCPLCEQLRPF